MGEVLKIDEKKPVFDYSILDNEVLIDLKNDENEINNILEMSSWLIGKVLIRVKNYLPHGQFRSWLELNWGWSKSTANNMMNIAKSFKCPPDGHLISKGALNLLAAPSTPEPARQEALDLAADGEKINQGVAKELKEKYKKLEHEKEILKNEKFHLENQKKLIENDRDDLKKEFEKALAELEEKSSEVVEVTERLENFLEFYNPDLLDYDESSIEKLEKVRQEYELKVNSFDAYRSRLSELERRIKDYEKEGTGKEIVRTVIEEKDVVPGDYVDLKERVKSLTVELDRLSAKNKEQSEKYESFKRESKFSKHLAIIEQNIKILFDAAMELPKDKIIDIPLQTQTMIKATITKLNSISPLADETKITNKASLVKLSKAGYIAYRPDEKNKRILIFNTERNSWIKHFDFETRKGMRESLKELLKSDMNIIC